MPGYALSPEDEGEGLLPWSWAVERLTSAHNYWVATGNLDGSPQLTAVWGVWVEGAFVFSCAPNARKAQNIATNPRCTISTEHAEEAVIVEGEASEVTDPETLQAFKAAYDPKYDWEIGIDRGGIYRVAPKTVFAFIEHSNKFQKTATRWRFDA